MGKSNVKAYIRWIFQKIKRRFPLILMLTLLSIAVSFSGICFVFFTKELVNAAIAADSQQLRRAAAFMIGLSLFQVLGNLIARYYSANVQEGLERDMKHSVLSTILRSEYSAISRHHSSDLIQRMDRAYVYTQSAVIAERGFQLVSLQCLIRMPFRPPK